MQKNKILKDKVYISITEHRLKQKDQFHHPQKKTHKEWSLLMHLHTM